MVPFFLPQEAFNYSKDINTSLAKDGDPQLGCGTFPLVIFSHGLDGCGAQSIFFTETLARSGYIVVAPDHQDALLCSVDGTGQTFERATEPAIMDPKTWDETSYKYRKDEIEAVLDGALADSQLKTMINAEQIGIAGHSLGGYTALAMAGGWPGWKDSRFKAALLMSPYSLPFSIKNTLKDVTIPVMYQGAQGDVGITPFVEGSRGAYANSNPPKYFMKLHGGNHFTWTNAVCAGSPLISDCLQSKADAKLIDDFGIAFFETFLKGKTEPLLTSGDGSLMAFMHQP